MHQGKQTQTDRRTPGQEGEVAPPEYQVYREKKNHTEGQEHGCPTKAVTPSVVLHDRDRGDRKTAGVKTYKTRHAQRNEARLF